MAGNGSDKSGSKPSGSARRSTYGSYFGDDETVNESLKLTQVQDSSQSHTHPTSPESQRSRQPGVELGTVIDQRFVLEKLLGRGGMNVVYRARDLVKEQARDPNPYVAIKILGAEFSKNPEAWITLQRETKKAQALAHPHIAIIHDFQIDRDTRLPFAQMEELKGEPLDRLLRRSKDGLEDREEATRIVTEIADGLAYAHRRGIVHCDLKPSNVFLTEDGDVKILDFGIARLLPGADDDEFDAGRIAALTPAYASCEMFERKPPHPSDDVYALGVIAYELYTGKHPYREALSSKQPALTAREQGMKVTRPAGLGRRRWRALQQSLSLDRADRPGDGTDFLASFSSRSPLPLALGLVSLVLGVALAWAVLQGPADPLPEVPFERLSAQAQADFRWAVDEGWVAMGLRDYNGALQYFSRAHDIHPFNPEATAGLDAIVEAVLDQPVGSDRESLEARLEQVSVLLSYDALETRSELVDLRDELQHRLER